MRQVNGATLHQRMDVRDWLGVRPRPAAPVPGPAPIPHAGMVAGPIVGYRLWRRDARGGLWSLYQDTRWPEGAPLEADGSLSALTYIPDYTDGVRKTATLAEHGIYAMKALADLDSGGMGRFVLGGRVALWGTVVEHHAGYRAQFAYPIDVWWAAPPDFRLEWPELPVPPTPRRLARLIEARYGVPVLDEMPKEA